MYRRIGTLILMTYSAVSSAAPAITSISGTIDDDQVVVINGSSFGTNPLKVEWLGGASGPIESGATHTSFLSTQRSGWYEDRDNNESFFDTRHAYSGSKALVFDPEWGRWRDGRFGLIYDTGGDIPELYSSYMAYFDNGGAPDGQWKMIRWSYTNSVTDDAVPNAYMANWAGAPGDFFNVLGGTTATKTHWFDTQALPLAGGWYRVETYIRPSSTPTASDGLFWVRTTRFSDGLVQQQQFNGVKNYSDGELRRYRYIVFQNYMGNGSYSGPPSPTKLWIDDLYVSQSQARVEICSASVWAQCTKKELQPPLSWSNNQISVRLNRGGLSSFTGAYLYVVDSTGTANSAGIPLVAGKVPVAPSTLTAQ